MADSPPRSGLWPQLRELTRHRVLGLLRQPEALFWTFCFPLVLALVLGFAFSNSEPARSAIGIVVDATDGDAPEWLARLERDPRVDLVRFRTEREARSALRIARIDLLVLDAASLPPQVNLDPSRNEAEVARLRVVAATRPPGGEDLAIEEVRERGSRYIDYLVPGLIGLNLMGTGLWSIGFAVADMRQRKLLKRLLVTPMRRSAFLGSFLLARLLTLGVELLVLLSFGVGVLGVPLRGSIATLALLCVLGAAAFAGLGLLVAARPRTIEGVSGLLNVVMFPMWLGSGVFFSYERYPEFVQPLLRALPLTAINDAVRAVMLEGAGPVAVLPQVGVLAAWLAVTFAVALRVFRWS